MDLVKGFATLMILFVCINLAIMTYRALNRKWREGLVSGATSIKAWPKSGGNLTGDLPVMGKSVFNMDADMVKQVSGDNTPAGFIWAVNGGAPLDHPVWVQLYNNHWYAYAQASPAGNAGKPYTNASVWAVNGAENQSDSPLTGEQKNALTDVTTSTTQTPSVEVDWSGKAKMTSCDDFTSTVGPYKSASGGWLRNDCNIGLEQGNAGCAKISHGSASQTSWGKSACGWGAALKDAGGVAPASAAAAPAATPAAAPTALSTSTYYCSSGSGEPLGTFAATSPEDCVTQCTVPYGSSRTGLSCSAGAYATTPEAAAAPAAPAPEPAATPAPEPEATPAPATPSPAPPATETQLATVPEGVDRQCTTDADCPDSYCKNYPSKEPPYFCHGLFPPAEVPTAAPAVSPTAPAPTPAPQGELNRDSSEEAPSTTPKAILPKSAASEATPASQPATTLDTEVARSYNRALQAQSIPRTIEVPQPQIIVIPITTGGAASAAGVSSASYPKETPMTRTTNMFSDGIDYSNVDLERRSGYWFSGPPLSGSKPQEKGAAMSACRTNPKCGGLNHNPHDNTYWQMPKGASLAHRAGRTVYVKLTDPRPSGFAEGGFDTWSQPPQTAKGSTDSTYAGYTSSNKPRDPNLNPKPYNSVWDVFP